MNATFGHNAVLICSSLCLSRELQESGERVSGKGADLYEMCDGLDAILRDNNLQKEHGIALKTIA